MRFEHCDMERTRKPRDRANGTFALRGDRKIETAQLSAIADDGRRSRTAAA
ncbi:MAG: hypothetical protein K2N56_01125 [Oscillospiraceae bacterium]|nr:hypothetical protein [Oscillospiraceae bacterium]